MQTYTGHIIVHFQKVRDPGLLQQLIENACDQCDLGPNGDYSLGGDNSEDEEGDEDEEGEENTEWEENMMEAVHESYMDDSEPSDRGYT